MKVPSKVEKRAQALNDAVNDHQGGLLKFIARKIRDEVEAQDIAQEVYSEYLEAYDVDSVFDSLGAWLTTVAQNKILDRFRKQKRVSEHQIQTRAEAPTEAISQNRPDEEWTRAWLREEIADALAELPDEQREVFVLYELEGRSFDEIATITGRGVNTLLSQKRYAIQFLRNHLKEVYDELE